MWQRALDMGHASSGPAVLGISDEPEEFTQFVPAMQRVIANTPEGRSGRPIV